MKSESPPPSLKGQLILADPTLREPHFARTVILMTEHRQDHGSHGFILNRPTEQTVGQLLRGPQFLALEAVPVFHGGPVNKEHLTFAAFAWADAAVAFRFVTHLSIEEATVHLSAGETVRAFLGYSGWGRGQLEAEIQEHAWISRQMNHQLLRGAADESLWTNLLTSLGPWGTLVAGSPDNPRLN